MIYRCRRCNCEESRGFLPTATCGMLFLAQLGISAAALLAILRYFRSLITTSPEVSAPDSSLGLGWWAIAAIPLAMIIGLGLLLVATLLLNVFMQLIEWLAFSLRRCRQCGCRRWSWGYTRGFGL